MSACADFADHVWKPGSCKNCFHPFSAHARADKGPEESPQNDPELMTCGSGKPTIAVRPTMINTLQEQRTQAALKKASLFIESNGCTFVNALLENAEDNACVNTPEDLMGTITQNRNNGEITSTESEDEPAVNELSNGTPPMTPDSFNSQSDSPPSFRSADSLQSPQNGGTEPIYAESTKRRPRAELGGEPQREENNCAPSFFLRGPVSLQFSPNVAQVQPDLCFSFAVHPNRLCSPPVPPKSKPRLGTSSLSLAPSLRLGFSGAPPPDWSPKHSTLNTQINMAAEGGTQVESVCDWTSESHAVPGTGGSSGQRARAEESEHASQEPPPPPPKKHPRAMDLQSSFVESLSQPLRGLTFCSSSESLQPSNCPPRSSPSPCSSSTFGSAPPSPQAASTPHLHHPQQPPPLPEKKQIGRTASAQRNTESKSSMLSSLQPHLLQIQPRPPQDSVTLQKLNSDSNLQLHKLTSPPSLQGGNKSLGSSLKLHTLLSNMDSRECVYSKLGGLYAESLRRLSLKCEEHFMGAQRSTQRFEESNWSLFKLTCSRPSCVSGDAVYYSASCATHSQSTYAVKICKGQTADCRQTHLYGLSVQQSLAPHFNLQQDCGHFIACVPHSMLPGEERTRREANGASLSEITEKKGEPAFPGNEVPTQLMLPGTQSEQERVVVITPDVPHQSVAEFVREWDSFHRAQPEVYERRVCFILLQLCAGLEHLKAQGVTHRDLCMENLLLVQHRASADPHQQSLPRLLISSFGKAKQRSVDDITIATNPQFKRDHARLAPEILSAAQYLKFDEFQTGILIYELLHCRNPFEDVPSLRRQEYSSEELPLIPSVSIYSPGLQRLSQLLLEPDPGCRIQIQEAKRILQALLWGPRRELLAQPWLCGGQGRAEALLNWLDVKRALLMMKFAERSLESERNAELEDWLCCQYFSWANPRALCQTAELLYSMPFPE